MDREKACARAIFVVLLCAHRRGGKCAWRGRRRACASKATAVEGTSASRPRMAICG